MTNPSGTGQNLETSEPHWEEPVFHKMRNILNSIHVSTGVIHQQIGDFHFEDVGRVADLLEAHSTNLGWFLNQDPKGRQIPHFLGQLGRELVQKHLATLRELNSLNLSLEQLECLVNTGQTRCRSGQTMDPIQFSSIVEEAIVLHQGELERLGVKVDRDYHPAQDGILEVSKLHQILVTLIRTAIRAMRELPDHAHHLILRVMNCPDRENFIRIQIGDTGIGIPTEHLTQVFAPPSPGPRSGSYLPNLHGSALAAKELGGSLRAWSEGPHHGTLVTLDIPVIHMEGKG